MKLLKHELNRYHRSVQECIRRRKEWITYYSIKLRWKKMRKEVDTFMVWNNPIMSFFLNIIYLPIKILKIYENIKIKHDMRKTEKEIEVLEKELVYIDNLRWVSKDENNLKLLK